MNMESFLEKAIAMLIARLPETTMEQVAKVARSGIQLQSQLDRIEAQQAAIVLSLQFLVKHIMGDPQSPSWRWAGPQTEKDFSYELGTYCGRTLCGLGDEPRDQTHLQLGAQSWNGGNRGAAEPGSGKAEGTAAAAGI
jgi:hypothetical protein